MSIHITSMSWTKETFAGKANQYLWTHTEDEADLEIKRRLRDDK